MNLNVEKNTQQQTTGGGIGFLGLLTIAFIVLKLTGYIAWSWWLILAPILVPLILISSVLCMWFILIVIFLFIDKRK